MELDIQLLKTRRLQIHENDAMSYSFNQDMMTKKRRNSVETIHSEHTPQKRKTKGKYKYRLSKYRNRDACQKKDQHVQQKNRRLVGNSKSNAGSLHIFFHKYN